VVESLGINVLVDKVAYNSLDKNKVAPEQFNWVPLLLNNVYFPRKARVGLGPKGQDSTSQYSQRVAGSVV